MILVWSLRRHRQSEKAGSRGSDRVLWRGETPMMESSMARAAFRW
jgi:hypothetical protein